MGVDDRGHPRDHGHDHARRPHRDHVYDRHHRHVNDHRFHVREWNQENVGGPRLLKESKNGGPESESTLMGALLFWYVSKSENCGYSGIIKG